MSTKQYKPRTKRLGLLQFNMLFTRTLHHLTMYPHEKALNANIVDSYVAFTTHTCSCVILNIVNADVTEFDNVVMFTRVINESREIYIRREKNTA